LKSFRTSPWDPYENLPLDYGRIFQFQNFKRSKKRVMDSLEKGVQLGNRVTIEIKNVPCDILDNVNQSTMFPIFGLLPYEHKLSIVNFVIQRSSEFTETVKSKDKVIIMCGFRQYVVQPLYSTYTRGGPNNVHKFERFLQNGRASVATVYAPIQFGPTPILMFKYQTKTSWGSGMFFILI
jgi:pre-rRNA-processing protein TSR1